MNGLGIISFFYLQIILYDDSLDGPVNGKVMMGYYHLGGQPASEQQRNFDFQVQLSQKSVQYNNKNVMEIRMNQPTIRVPN